MKKFPGFNISDSANYSQNNLKNQTIKHTLLKSDNEKKFLDTRPNSLQPHCELTREYIWFLADLYFPKYKSNVFRTEMHKGIPILEKKRNNICQ